MALDDDPKLSISLITLSLKALRKRIRHDLCAIQLLHFHGRSIDTFKWTFTWVYSRHRNLTAMRPFTLLSRLEVKCWREGTKISSRSSVSVGGDHKHFFVRIDSDSLIFFTRVEVVRRGYGNVALKIFFSLINDICCAICSTLAFKLRIGCCRCRSQFCFVLQ